jgi:hypothetical protein
MKDGDGRLIRRTNGDVGVLLPARTIGAAQQAREHRLAAACIGVAGIIAISLIARLLWSDDAIGVQRWIGAALGIIAFGAAGAFLLLRAMKSDVT